MWVVQKLDINLLTKRAELFAQLRSFFLQRQVLEVDAPLIAAASVTDIHIESIPVLLERLGQQRENYLITSPEFHMKQLLAAGSPSIYYLGKVFRQGEHGGRHHHEFTMLEWYRIAWHEHQLMDEVCELLRMLLPGKTITKVTYGELFFSILKVNPHRATLLELRQCVQRCVEMNDSPLTLTDCLDVLFSHCIEPTLQDITFVYNYPASQAALAKITRDEQGDRVARRFEVFIDGLELANGYCELTDADEQRKRFAQDIEWRRQQNKKNYPVDESLLRALEAGLPECAGVAIGIDRLLIKMLDKEKIQHVIPFLK
jgi:lysyl-tRNA synthetase class 2